MNTSPTSPTPSPTAGYGLAIHTTTPQLGLAIANHDGLIRSQTWDLGRAMSTHLHLYLTEFLQPQTWADLAFIAVARGPGGFTGTRLGVVTARILAQQLNCPLFAVSTLAAIAWSAAPTAPASDIAVEMPARRGDVFAAIYSLSVNQSANATSDLPIKSVLADTVLAAEAWQQTLAAHPQPYHRVIAEGGLGHTAPHLLELALFDWQRGDRPHWSAALPYYGQSPV
ncbi:MAG: tRNA (adenosine(37)-N6)-threonylcarbamoyltransferase complex dimerization subunit type 1 TsaB [Synechococcales bacterium]|nr:tRNA (adenosine(37)-N6)-threonylcarbamoyltransferase complex dimerization subunit type 1 TsaB [Synechococcales bacterium]